MLIEGTETQEKSVRCIFCAQQIPLSPRLASIYAVSNEEGKDSEERRRSRIMILRCSKCSREAPYRRDDVVISHKDSNAEAAETVAPQLFLKAFRRAAS